MLSSEAEDLLVALTGEGMGVGRPCPKCNGPWTEWAVWERERLGENVGTGYWKHGFPCSPRSRIHYPHDDEMTHNG